MLKHDNEGLCQMWEDYRNVTSLISIDLVSLSYDELVLVSHVEVVTGYHTPIVSVSSPWGWQHFPWAQFANNISWRQTEQDGD